MHRIRGRWAAIAATLATAACGGHNPAPKGWLPGPAQAQSTAYGGWIELTYQESEQQQRRTEGELIAVSADSVWILVDTQGIAVPTSVVRRGTLTAYAAETGKLTNWTLLGTLSTVSNGAFLIFTAPMWLIGGSLATGGESRSARGKAPPLSWTELAPYARFPQGMPDGLELRALQPKKVPGPDQLPR